MSANKNTKVVPVPLMLKGFTMGMAEIVPGVSGGTIAFITGIFERFMAAIKSFGPGLFGDFRSGGVKKVWASIDGNFLVLLFSGMAIGLVVGAFGISYLLEHHPLPLWGFFFGLIIASCLFVLRQIGAKTWEHYLSFIIGAVAAYIITALSPTEGNFALWYVFISGSIAISAMLLPGISGSFILMLMGMYRFILDSFKTFLSTRSFDQLLVIIVFGLGCIAGAMTFSRLITWTLTKYRKITLSVLAGFLLGSLNKIWPWRIPSLWMNEEGEIMSGTTPDEGKVKILQEINLLPMDYPSDPQIFIVITTMLVGLLLVFWLERMPLAASKENTNS